MPSNRGRALADYGRLPLSFEANQGQSVRQVKFLAHGRGYTLLLTGNSAVLSLQGRKKPDPNNSKPAAQTTATVAHSLATNAPGLPRYKPFKPCFLHVKIADASANATVAGENKLPGKVNYYIGNNPKNWHTNIPTYARVKYRNIYPGINLVYYGNQQRVEYDFVVSPGADADHIKLDLTTTPNLSQADRSQLRAPALHIASNGDLIIKSKAGKVRFEAPLVYQPIATPAGGATSAGIPPASRRYIKARYVLGPHGQVGFHIASYDHSRPLVIDPVLSYATYLMPGAQQGGATGIGVDQSGDAYVTGIRNTSGYPDVVVFGLNPQGDTFLYTTYLGGTNGATPDGIAVDAQGDAYIDGAASSGFPTTPGAYQSTGPGGFAVKLSPSGSVEYSTFVGPQGPRAIAIDASGDAYITGGIGADGLPVVNAYQPQYAGSICTSCSNAFVQKLNPTGSQFIYSTYFGLGGANNNVTGTGIAVDSSGSAYVIGTGAVPLKNPLQQGVGDMFLAKFTPDGTGLVYSTQLGGSAWSITDKATAVAVDSSGNVYVAGDAVSPDFPTTMNAFKASCYELPVDACEGPQVFVMKIDSTGTSLNYSTLLGEGNAMGVAADSKGNVWVAGGTSSSNFPVINPIQAHLQQISSSYPIGDGFVTRLNSNGVPTLSTFLGGSFTDDEGVGVAVDGNGNAYVTGSIGIGNDITNDSPVDFPVLNPTSTIQSQILFSTPEGIFAAKINPSQNGPQLSLSPRYDTVLELRNVSISTLTLSSITISSGMVLAGGTCGSSLSPGGDCTLIVEPAQQNPGTATLTIDSNAPGNPQQFTIYAASPEPIAEFVSPSLIEFPAQMIGTISAPQTVTLTNLHYPNAMGFSLLNSDPGDFTETDNCSTGLPAGSSCTLHVEFQPTAGSSQEDYNSFSINTGSGYFDVGARGIRSSSSILASTTTVQFGTQYVGATPLPRVVTLTNTDVQPVTVGGISVSPPFTETNNCSAPLAPHASCRVAISFVPAGNINATGQLTVNFGGQGSPVTVNLVGTGEILADLAVSPLQLSFGNVSYGYSYTKPLTLSNISTSTFTISAFNLDSSNYTETNDCNGSLAPQATCTVNVTYTPTALTEQDGTLTIDFSGKGSPQIVSLTGAGVTALGVNPSSLSFGEQPVGQTSPSQTVGLYNRTSTTTITVNSISISSGFKIVSNQCSNTLKPSYGCTLDIAFTPTSTGLKTGTLTVSASDYPDPHTVELSGTGAIVPEVSLSPTTLSFGPIVDGTSSSPQTVTVKNTGNATLTVADVSTSGDFSQTNNCISVAAGSTCTINVTFSPTVGGQRTGSLTISDNAQNSPQTVALTGQSEDFTLTLPSNETSSQTVQGGSSMNLQLNVTPQGGFNQEVALNCSGAPPQGSCTVSPTPVTLNGQSSQNVSVAVTTTAGGLVTPGPNGGPPAPRQPAVNDWWIAALLLMGLLFMAFVRRRRASLLAGSIVLAALALSCGGGGGSNAGGGTAPPKPTGTPAGTYNLVVTGTSGKLTHQIKLTLTVQ